MHLINDYSQQVLTDQRERDLARLAEHRLLARPKQRIGIAAQRRTAQRGMAMPKRRVAR